MAATLDVGRHLRRNFQVRSAERGRGHAHAHQGQSRMSGAALGRLALACWLDNMKTPSASAKPRCDGKVQVSESPRKLRTHSATRHQSKPWTAPRRHFARAGDERTGIVKDRSRHHLFAVAAVPRATSDLAGRRMLGPPALFR